MWGEFGYGDAGRHDTPCSRMLQLAWEVGRAETSTESARTGQGGVGSVTKSTKFCQVSSPIVNC
jgi:hypothetical protein